MLSVLGLGFLIGLQHAFEADHLAAVSSMASSETSLKKLMQRGAFWGAGHMVMLFLVAGSFLLFGQDIPANIERILETIVAVMLVLLGLHVLYKMRKERIHIHVHTHKNNPPHLHAHIHQKTSLDDNLHVGAEEKHAHKHPERLINGKSARVFFVGLIHGTAGSAALLALTVAAIKTPLMGLFYILIFGAGSMIGMAVLSAVIALPLKLSSRYLDFAHQSMQMLIGAGTIFVGTYMFYDLGYI
jgi:ABC-type nickel/cobalt efflux system permease component RcnA